MATLSGKKRRALPTFLTNKKQTQEKDNSNILSTEFRETENVMVTREKPHEVQKRMLELKERSLCHTRQLSLRDDGSSETFSLLKTNCFLTLSRPKKVPNVKKAISDSENNQNPIRLTFFNGGTGRFPFAFWNDVYMARVRNIVADKIMYDNDIAISSEGVRLFIEMDYRDAFGSPSDETIFTHASTCRDVVKRFFPDGNSESFDMWVLLSEPKLKYTKSLIDPVIAMGCHIVFPNLVVTCAQGSQICHSANIDLEAKHGIANVVDDCYHTETVSLRPMYGRKLEMCLLCLGDFEMKVSCTVCKGRGKVPSPSVYKPWNYIVAGEKKFESRELLEEYVNQNLFEVVRGTSIVSPEPGVFPSNYILPPNEPVAIPTNVRSKHSSDILLGFVYKQDRHMISKRNRTTMEPVSDSVSLKLITRIIRSFHTVYDDDRFLVSNVVQNDNTIMIDVKGVGRTFCRIFNREGIHHNSNRVYFRISRCSRIVEQCCYNTDCKREITGSERKNNRITKNLSQEDISSLFKKKRTLKPKKKDIIPKMSDTKNRCELMMDFINAN